MADIAKGTVVYITGATSSRAKVTPFDPTAGNAGAIVTGHASLYVAMTDSDADEELALLRCGYLRDLGSSHITGWEPAEGALIWCGAGGKPTDTRPTTGYQVLVGVYIGGGVLAVNVQPIFSIGDLSYVKREVPEEFDVFIWSPSDGAYVPRQIDHGQDLAGLEDDDHPRYLEKTDLRNVFLFMGGD